MRGDGPPGTQGRGASTMSQRGEDREGSRRGSAGEIRRGEEDCRGRKEVERGRGTEAGGRAATGGHRVGRIPAL